LLSILLSFKSQVKCKSAAEARAWLNAIVLSHPEMRRTFLFNSQIQVSKARDEACDLTVY